MKLKILVLDDEAPVADSLVQILRMFGYDASAGYDPSNILDRFIANPFDIVISDVVFEGNVTGIDLAIQLQTLYPDCKVMLLSGNNSTAQLLRDAQAQGYAFEILAKPVHPQLILERLRSMAHR